MPKLKVSNFYKQAFQGQKIPGTTDYVQERLRSASWLVTFSCHVGIGTLPTQLATGFMASWLTRFARSTTARQVVGVIIIAMAIGSLFIPLGESGHGRAD